MGHADKSQKQKLKSRYLKWMNYCRSPTTFAIIK